MNVPAAETAGTGRRIPELDGLRGLAILLVLIWHLFAGRPIRRSRGARGSGGIQSHLDRRGPLLCSLRVPHRRDHAGSPPCPEFLRRVSMHDEHCAFWPLYYLVLGGFLLATRRVCRRNFPSCEISSSPRIPGGHTCCSCRITGFSNGRVGTRMAGRDVVAGHRGAILPALAFPAVARAAEVAAVGSRASARSRRRSSASSRSKNIPSAPGRYVWMPARADALCSACWARGSSDPRRGAREGPARARWLHLSLVGLAVGVGNPAPDGRWRLFLAMIGFGYTWMAMFYLALLLAGGD
jgi:hypothetical protein